MVPSTRRSFFNILAVESTNKRRRVRGVFWAFLSAHLIAENHRAGTLGVTWKS